MQRRPLVSLFKILCKYILMCLSLYLSKKVNLLNYFPIHLVKAIPRNPAPIPITHPVWAPPNIDLTPAPRNVQPTNTPPDASVRSFHTSSPPFLYNIYYMQAKISSLWTVHFLDYNYMFHIHYLQVQMSFLHQFVT